METKARTGTIGRYEIVRQLGRGAMGTVYLANDPVIGRRIALKVLRLDLPGVEASAGKLRSRFQREAQSAGILSHPNIVTVYDAIEELDDGALCIAMEYVDGTNLSDILRRPEPLAKDFALDIAAQIADALEYAHGQGVIHRDIKPANVIVTSSGLAKITDFGIAHLIDSALSEDLRFLGTPSYMAPERIEGKEIDSRADLFSIGVVLYQLVTRHMPFHGATVAELTRSIARDEPTPPERYVPGMTAELHGILSRSLEKNPDKRYQRAAEISNDLRALLSNIAAQHRTQPVEPTQPVPSMVPPALASGPIPPTGSAPPSASPPAAKSNRIWKVAAGLLGFVAVAAVAWGLMGRGDGPPAQAESRAPARTSTASALPSYIPALVEGERRLNRGDMEGAAELLRSAVILEPDSTRAQMMSAAVEEMMRRDAISLQEIEILSFAEEGRAALSRGRLNAARSALALAEAIDAEHESVVDLRSRVWLAEQPKRAPQPTAVVAEEMPPLVEEVEPQIEEVDLATEPVSDIAKINLDFFSLASRGVLTIYEGDRQIYREAFRFVERRRFLPPKPATGSLGGLLELPSGSRSLRVYLSLPGRETQIVKFDEELEGGSTKVLRMRVSDNGVFTATLR